MSSDRMGFRSHPYEHLVEWLPQLFSEGAALIIVPPFVHLDRPVLGAHLLQACAKQAGHKVSVLYANMLFARAIGCRDYDALVGSSRMMLAQAGERIFARSAHGIRPLGAWPRSMYDVARVTGSGLAASRFPYSENERALGVDRLFAIERTAHAWVRTVAQALGRLPFHVFGCTLMFEQTNAGLALLRGLRKVRGDAVTILGGASCAHPMGEGLLSVDPKTEYLDYVFSGDSEATFPNFLNQLGLGDRPAHRLIRSDPCEQLVGLPLPDYQEYFEQRACFLSSHRTRHRSVSLPYEISRGCWWGESSPCTFCGHAYDTMRYRAKSPERVVEDLAMLVHRHGVRDIFFADSITPKAFVKEFVPRLAKADLKLRIFLEQRPNLSLRELVLERQAGVEVIQPGIESFASSMLRRMRKGIHARQNLMLLRNAASVGMRLAWCLMWDLPGDRREDYEASSKLMPLLHHLQPPFAMHHSLTRFSSYHSDPSAYGIDGMAPYASYAAVLPKAADVGKIARFFMTTLSEPPSPDREVFETFLDALARWRRVWHAPQSRPPLLRLTRSDRGFMLWDTRGVVDAPPIQRLTRARAKEVMLARPYRPSQDLDWAIQGRIGVLLEGWYVPLVTADPALLLNFEGLAKRST